MGRFIEVASIICFAPSELVAPKNMVLRTAEEAQQAIDLSNAVKIAEADLISRRIQAKNSQPRFSVRRSRLHH